MDTNQLPQPTTDTLRDVSVTKTFRVRVNGSLAIGGFSSVGAAAAHFRDRGYDLRTLSITPETRLVLR